MAYTIKRCSTTATDSCEKGSKFTVRYTVGSQDKNELDPGLLTEGSIATGSNTPWQPNTAYTTSDVFQITIPSTGGPWVDNTSTTIAPGTYDASYPTNQTSGASFDEAELAKMVVGSSVVVLPECQDRYVTLGGTALNAYVRSRSIGGLKNLGSAGYSREVTVEYQEFMQEISSQDPGGGTPGFEYNPLNFCPEIKISLFKIKEGRHIFFFLGYMSDVGDSETQPCAPLNPANLLDVANSCVVMPKNTNQPLQTTAGEALSPVERDFDGLEFDITFNRAGWEFDKYGCFIDTINNADFTLDILCNRGFSYTFPQYSVWLKSVTCEPAEIEIPVGEGTQTLYYVKVTYKLAYNPRTWVMDIPNRGVLRCIWDNGNDVDGRNGFFGIGSSAPEGMANNVGVNDPQGNIVNAPIWLNRAGLPAKDGSFSYLRYLEIPHASDFSDPTLKLVNWNTP